MAGQPVPQRAGQWRAGLYPGECCGAARVAWLCVEPRSAGAVAEGLRCAPRLAPAQRRAARPPAGPAEVSARCPPPLTGRRAEAGSGRQGEGYPRPTLSAPHPGGGAALRAPPPSPRGVGGREGGAELPVPCATSAAAPSHFSSLSSALPWFESLDRGGTGGLVLPALCPAGRAGVAGGVLPGRGEVNCHTAQCI